MNNKTMRRALFAGLLFSCALAQQAPAQLNPSRQITIVVPIGAGGGVDATGRLIAEKLQERLKQPVVVENRPASGGMVGADSVAKAAPDGHTLLLMESSSSLHKWLRKDVPFDVITDFTPIAQVANSPVILFAQPSFGPNNASDVIALAKAEPGKLSVGTPGLGTPHHLAMLMMNTLAKIDIVNVPYRGAALVVNDVLGGQLPMGWAAPTAVMPHVAAGKLKVLGVASPQREPLLPHVPTLAESGIPGFGMVIWFGVAAPAKTPPDVVARLSKEIAEIAALPDVKQRIERVGLSLAYTDGDAFRKLIRGDHERFGRVIRDAGIVPN
jgi:tripartite-type tricarboxylate transporter receptor subunit TctC